MTDRKKVVIEEWLYRRSYPGKKYMNPDGTATSRVFVPRPQDGGELSVDVKSMTTPEKAILNRDKFSLFEISNRAVEEIQLETFHDPLVDGTNPAHAVIVGFKDDDETAPGYLARKSRLVRITPV